MLKYTHRTEWSLAFLLRPIFRICKWVLFPCYPCFHKQQSKRFNAPSARKVSDDWHRRAHHLQKISRGWFVVHQSTASKQSAPSTPNETVFKETAFWRELHACCFYLTLLWLYDVISICLYICVNDFLHVFMSMLSNIRSALKSWHRVLVVSN